MEPTFKSMLEKEREALQKQIEEAQIIFQRATGALMMVEHLLRAEKSLSVAEVEKALGAKVDKADLAELEANDAERVN